MKNLFIVLICKLLLMVALISQNPFLIVGAFLFGGAVVAVHLPKLFNRLKH